MGIPINGFIFVYNEHKNKYLYLWTRGVSHWVVVKGVICTHAGKDFGRDLAPSKWNKGVLRAVSLENGHLLNVVWLFDLQKKVFTCYTSLYNPNRWKNVLDNAVNVLSTDLKPVKYWYWNCEIKWMKTGVLQKINIFIKRFKNWAPVPSIAFKTTNQILYLHLE